MLARKLSTAVYQNVPAQAGRMEKRLRTLGALVQINDRTFAVLSVEVLLQNVTLRKRFVAFRARIRPLAGVYHFVALEDLLLDERSAAHFALERLLAGVRAMVADERAFAGEPLEAVFAHVAATVFVHRHVAGELNASGERFGTAVALEDLHFAVFIEIHGLHVVQIADGDSTAQVVGHLDFRVFGIAIGFPEFVLVVGLHPDAGIRFDRFLREKKESLELEDCIYKKRIFLC